MSIFQKAADWIRKPSPKWFVKFTDYLMTVVIIPSLEKMGEEILSDIRKSIIDASRKDWTNVKKFAYVFDDVWERWGSIKNLKVSGLNLMIEMTVNELKSKGFI